MAQRKMGKFLKKLFSILDNKQYLEVICWDSFGETVLIKNQSKLQLQIIPQHFSLRKFSSFVRQLHLYNFHKQKSKGNNDLVFYNAFFKRQARDLAAKVIRKRKTKAQMLLSSNSKESQKTIQGWGLTLPDQLNICHVQDNFKTKENVEQREQEEIKSMASMESLGLISLKSFSQLQQRIVDPYDLLNIL